MDIAFRGMMAASYAGGSKLLLIFDHGDELVTLYSANSVFVGYLPRQQASRYCVFSAISIEPCISSSTYRTVLPSRVAERLEIQGFALFLNTSAGDLRRV